MRRPRCVQRLQKTTGPRRQRLGQARTFVLALAPIRSHVTWNMAARTLQSASRKWTRLVRALEQCSAILVRPAQARLSDGARPLRVLNLFLHQVGVYQYEPSSLCFVLVSCSALPPTRFYICLIRDSLPASPFGSDTKESVFWVGKRAGNAEGGGFGTVGMCAAACNGITLCAAGAKPRWSRHGSGERKTPLTRV
jgi:hypothetical protein